MLKSEKLIRLQVERILNSPQFVQWKADNVKKAGHIILNNSFFFRQGVKSNKSEQYLGFVSTSGADDLTTSRLQVISGVTINKDFQFFPEKNSQIRSITLDKATTSDLIKNFGRVGFVFIGNVFDDVSFSEPIDEADFRNLILEPKQSDLIRIKNQDIVIRELIDEDSLWHELENRYSHNAKGKYSLPESLANPLSTALKNLRVNAYARLKIPENTREVKSTMVDSIIRAFEEAAKGYQVSLDKCKGDHRTDPNEFNNVLRIAYNFTSDAMEMLKIIVHMSDIKPIILFTTIHSQFELSNALKELPWPRSEKKGSLQLYESTVKGARNHAFHRLFPFSKAIDVDVSGLAFRAKRLRLFPEFTNKKNNTLDYEDRDLVELLTQFSRTSEHTVTPVFWKKNLVVIERTIDLLKQFKAALIAILSDQKKVTRKD